MHDDISPPDAERTGHDGRYRAIEFADGLLVFDRESTAGWIHSDVAVPLVDAR